MFSSFKCVGKVELVLVTAPCLRDRICARRAELPPRENGFSACGYRSSCLSHLHGPVFYVPTILQVFPSDCIQLQRTSPNKVVRSVGRLESLQRTPLQNAVSASSQIIWVMTAVRKVRGTKVGFRKVQGSYALEMTTS